MAQNLHYQFKKLTLADITAYMDLQSKIIPAATVNGLCRIKPRDASYIAAHIQTMPAFGFVDTQTGALAATALVTYPDNPLALHMDSYPFIDKLSDVFVVQGLYVSPDHQKKGLSSLLLTQAFAMAADDGRHIAYAKTGSEHGKKSFAKSGFVQVAGGIDYLHGYDVAYMRREECALPQVALRLPAPAQFGYI